MYLALKYFCIKSNNMKSLMNKFIEVLGDEYVSHKMTIIFGMLRAKSPYKFY